jgi:hypothetical protein
MGQALKSEHFRPSSTEPVRMADWVMQFAPATDADALKLLRSSFPDCSLSMRVAALDVLLRRKPRSAAHPAK